MRQIFNVKIFWDFDTVVQKRFPIAMVSLLCNNLILYIFSLMQEFNPFCPHLVLWFETFLFNLDWFEQPFIFVSSKVPFAKLWPEECSYKTDCKNAEAAVRKCSSK